MNITRSQRQSVGSAAIKGLDLPTALGTLESGNITMTLNPRVCLWGKSGVRQHRGHDSHSDFGECSMNELTSSESTHQLELFDLVASQPIIPPSLVEKINYNKLMDSSWICVASYGTLSFWVTSLWVEVAPPLMQATWTQSDECVSMYNHHNEWRQALRTRDGWHTMKCLDNLLPSPIVHNLVRTQCAPSATTFIFSASNRWQFYHMPVLFKY